MAVYLGTNPVSVYNGGQTSVKIEEKTVTAGTSTVELTPDSGKYLSKVTVNPTPSQSKIVTPSSVDQNIIPDNGRLLSSVAVSGDADLVAENIKSGVNIFGIDGTFEGKGQYVWERYEYLPYEIVSWADGTDEQIVEMVKAADRGEINLTDYWSVGDERQVTLSAMDATGVGESHVAQTVTMVLMNAGGKTLANATPSGRTECSFVVGMKNGLVNGKSSEDGYMNSSNTNSGGWENSARRTWCNTVFRNAIPSALREIFKQHLNVTANGSSDTTAESSDYFALPAEKEVFGSNTHANSTAESSLTQFEYYKTSANRIKKYGESGSAWFWWERSPDPGTSTHFCLVTNGGSATSSSATSTYLLAPFGVI